ncbi:MAG TPA: CsgG/HfaB family protein [Thermoanaerobaculia bacterium]|jgi:curli biogenesis system outer membrane secretion channel CsgG|nr:CsgG/HfaB family protein [Thermoanaerobaculia bacterium]
MSTKRLRGLAALLLASVLTGSPLFAGSSPTGSLRYSVFVDKFENKSDFPALGNEWATLLTSALHESGRFIVVAQEDMQHSALKEQGRGASGTTTQGRKTAARSRMTPAQLLVKGVITHVQKDAGNQDGGFGIGGIKIGAARSRTEVRGTIQMIDATTGSLVASKNFSGVAQGRGLSFQFHNGDRDGGAKSGEKDDLNAALEKAISDIIPWMVSQLPSVPWRGSVVKVAGDDVIINRGSREGVVAGDEFVAGESEILSDPDTGETLDEVVHERARIRVVRVNDRTAVCSVVKGDLSQIIEGMGIQHGHEKG